jgi:hypothetical protein
MRNELLEREVFHSVEKVRVVVEVSSDTKLGFATSPDVGYNLHSIKSRADALANLPGPGKVVPERGCGRKATKRATLMRQPSSETTEGGLFNDRFCQQGQYPGDRRPSTTRNSSS